MVVSIHLWLIAPFTSASSYGCTNATKAWQLLRRPSQAQPRFPRPTFCTDSAALTALYRAGWKRTRGTPKIATRRRPRIEKHEGRCDCDDLSAVHLRPSVSAPKNGYDADLRHRLSTHRWLGSTSSSWPASVAIFDRDGVVGGAFDAVAPAVQQTEDGSFATFAFAVNLPSGIRPVLAIRFISVIDFVLDGSLIADRESLRLGSIPDVLDLHVHTFTPSAKAAPWRLPLTCNWAPSSTLRL